MFERKFNEPPPPTPTFKPESAGYPFPTILDPVRVPPGHYPIEIVQFWRGEYAPRQPLPLHWTIVVRTSPHRGNTHEIVGDTDTYATQDRFDVPLAALSSSASSNADSGWRGSHVVGYVAPARMDDLLNAIALVPVVRHRLSWNCQNWVYEALRALRTASDADGGVGPALYADVGGDVSFEKLQTHMLCLLDAWEMGEI